MTYNVFGGTLNPTLLPRHFGNKTVAQYYFTSCEWKIIKHECYFHIFRP